MTATLTTTTAIRHRFGIDAPRAEVHRALTTIDGLASWWTADTTGDAAEGGTIRFCFGRNDQGEDRDMTFEVTEVTADRVAWRCITGPAEWVATPVTFDLDQQGDETVVLFAHGEWREPVPFQAHCSIKWAMYLLGMKALLEGGEATPWPRDLHVSSWD